MVDRMKRTRKNGRIIIPANRKPWPHELRTARMLAVAGYCVEFLSEKNLHTPDILLNDVEYEIKSPETGKTSSLEQSIRTALKQCPNVIIDSSRMKMHDDRVCRFLIKNAVSRNRLRK